MTSLWRLMLLGIALTLAGCAAHQPTMLERLCFQGNLRACIEVERARQAREELFWRTLTQ